MYLSEKIKLLQEHTRTLKTELNAMEKTLEEAKTSWPDNQIIPGVVWFDRSKTPPKGTIWASDGVRVWLINSDGLPIPAGATAVRFWTEALIPAPPSLIQA